MNTTSNALETYTNTLATVASARAEFDNNLFVKQRAILAGPTQRLATPEQVDEHHVTEYGGAIQRAGMTFLEAIHQDILANEPQWKKDIRENELENERRAQEKADCAEVAQMTSDE